jgi:quinol monooxygenase YgiN
MCAAHEELEGKPVRTATGARSTMFVITVRFAIKPGFEEPFLERVTVQARASLDAEADCRQFDVCRDREDPGKVFLYEVYAAEAAFNAHLQTPHFLAFDDGTRGWVDEKAVERWERVEAVSQP